MRTNTETAKLPDAEVYELECDVLPWAALLREVADWISKHTPSGGRVLDYMCGTGRLLHDISKARGDLVLAGCTLDPQSYVDYANARNPAVPVTYCDALAFQPPWTPDVVVCTGGIHHLPRAQQAPFIQKVASELPPGGWFIVGDEVIAHATSEVTRRMAALELFTGLASWCIRRQVPDPVQEAVLDILRNDLFERGEYKTDLDSLCTMLRESFEVHTVAPVWTVDSTPGACGDYLIVCRRSLTP